MYLCMACGQINVLLKRDQHVSKVCVCRVQALHKHLNVPNTFNRSEKETENETIQLTWPKEQVNRHTMKKKPTSRKLIPEYDIYDTLLHVRVALHFKHLVIIWLALLNSPILEMNGICVCVCISCAVVFSFSSSLPLSLPRFIAFECHACELQMISTWNGKDISEQCQWVFLQRFKLLYIVCSRISAFKKMEELEICMNFDINTVPGITYQPPLFMNELQILKEFIFHIFMFSFPLSAQIKCLATLLSFTHFGRNVIYPLILI